MKLVLIAAIGSIVATTVSAAIITEVSMPVGSQVSGSSAANTGIWSASYPIDTSQGVGFILNPDPFAYGSFAMHGGLSSDDMVTYKFNTSTVVDQLELVQHANGITSMEIFVGNDLQQLVSIGNFFGPRGDLTGYAAFTDGENNVFEFNNTTPGLYFRFKVTKINYDQGFANYRAYPRDASGNRFSTTAVPEPSTYGIVALGMVGLFAWRNRK
jgi:hypothetical protein